MNDVERRLLFEEMEKCELEEDMYITKERIAQLKEEERIRNGIYTRKDIKPDSLIGGWMLYIIVMIGGLIFNDYILLAIFATVYFFYWRRKEIDKANGRRYDD